jgi:gamma-glutamyltranspeptidase/glutathione hydrolase
VVGATIERWPADVAVARPRTHPVGRVLHVEPGLPPEVEDHLRAAGWLVQTWAGRDAYFGGASMVGRTGAGADPRRDGAAVLLT